MKAVILACVLLLPAVASAEEYTLYVNDAASCRAAGFTGDVCIVKKEIDAVLALISRN